MVIGRVYPEIGEWGAGVLKKKGHSKQRACRDR